MSRRSIRTGDSGVPDLPRSSSFILILGVFRVNAGAWNTLAVETAKGSTTSTYQGSSRTTGTRRSPVPSPHAASPRTNTGTSAPSLAPSAASRSVPIPRPQSQSSPISADAASLLPPPRPPPSGMRLSTAMSAPASIPDFVAQEPRGPDNQIVRLLHAGNRRGAAQERVVAARDAHAIGEIEELEYGLKLVVAIGAPPDDVQEQVELRRCGKLDYPRLNHSGAGAIGSTPVPPPLSLHPESRSTFHRRTMTVASTDAFENRMRSGSESPSRVSYRS